MFSLISSPIPRTHHHKHHLDIFETISMNTAKCYKPRCSCRPVLADLRVNQISRDDMHPSPALAQVIREQIWWLQRHSWPKSDSPNCKSMASKLRKIIKFGQRHLRGYPRHPESFPKLVSSWMKTCPDLVAHPTKAISRSSQSWTFSFLILM